tara:strand:+ start:27 stop:275 length:249 start_codon:yes stop_codon:yes gene_type:complete
MSEYMSRYMWAFDDMGTPVDVEEKPLKLFDICSPCAEKLGGVWPEGHEGWFNDGTCDACKNKCTVCSRRNWGLTIDGKPNRP